jgi:hypothetical protein
MHTPSSSSFLAVPGSASSPYLMATVEKPWRRPGACRRNSDTRCTLRRQQKLGGTASCGTPWLPTGLTTSVYLAPISGPLILSKIVDTEAYKSGDQVDFN